MKILILTDFQPFQISGSLLVISTVSHRSATDGPLRRDARGPEPTVVGTGRPDGFARALQAAVGAALGLCGYDFDYLVDVLRDEFISHGEKVAEDNVTAARAGYDYALESGAEKLSHKIQAVGGSNKRICYKRN